MKTAATLALAMTLACGCKTADPGVRRDPTEAATTASTKPFDASRVTLVLTTSTTKTAAGWGDGGGFAAPKVVLTLSLKNDANVPVSTGGEVELEIRGERGKKSSRTRLALSSPMVVAAAATETRTIEAGGPMVDVASLFMKGDLLHVRAYLPCVSPLPAWTTTSNEIDVQMFVPEG